MIKEHGMQTIAMNIGVTNMWRDMDSAPKDGTPILAWCVHENDPYYIEEEKRLTVYGAQMEVWGSHAENGPNVIVWGGSWDDSSYEEPNAGYMPDWWFLYGSDFEVVANPVVWMPIEEFSSLNK